MLRVQLGVMAIFALVLAILLPSINAQSPAPAPPPTSDGLFSPSLSLSLSLLMSHRGKQML